MNFAMAYPNWDGRLIDMDCAVYANGDSMSMYDPYTDTYIHADASQLFTPPPGAPYMLAGNGTMGIYQLPDGKIQVNCAVPDAIHGSKTFQRVFNDMSDQSPAKLPDIVG